MKKEVREMDLRDLQSATLVKEYNEPLNVEEEGLGDEFNELWDSVMDAWERNPDQLMVLLEASGL